MLNIKSLFAAMIIGCCMPVAAQNVHIHGTVSGFENGTVVYLMLSDALTASSIASDTIYNGVLSLKATVDDGLSIGELMFNDKKVPSITGREFYLAPGADIEITFSDIKELKSYPLKSNIPQQAEFDRFIEKSRRQLEDFVAVFTEGRPFPEIIAKSDSISDIILVNDMGLLSDTPVGDVWLDKMTDLASGASYKIKRGDFKHLDALRALYERIPEDRRDESPIERIKAYLYPVKSVDVGDDYADAEMFDLEGNSHSLSEFAGKWILLDFWSRGCYPCVMAIPELGSFSKAHSKDVAVVSISSDGIDSWKDASKAHNITWNNWSDGKMDTGIYAVYGCDAIPTFVIISPEGKIADKWAGYYKGIFEQRLQSQLYKRKTSVYSRQGGRVSVENPQCENNATGQTLYISKIENADNGVTLFFDAYSSPELWIKVSPDSWIQTGDGNRYKVTGSEGITLGENYYVGEDGCGSFSITFEPIDGDAEKIDFHESENKNDFHIIGLRLKE